MKRTAEEEFTSELKPCLYPNFVRHEHICELCIPVNLVLHIRQGARMEALNETLSIIDEWWSCPEGCKCSLSLVRVKIAAIAHESGVIAHDSGGIIQETQEIAHGSKQE